MSFVNVHYFAAGATLFGTDVKGGYEYDGKTYNGRFEHVSGIQTCTDCHDTHALEVKYESCGGCHPSVATADDLETIRITAGDFDGDGDEAEGLALEIETMQEVLLEAIYEYVGGVSGAEAIVYDSHAYPYFFIDTNANGESDPGEAIFPNATTPGRRSSCRLRTTTSTRLRTREGSPTTASTCSNCCTTASRASAAAPVEWFDRRSELTTTIRGAGFSGPSYLCESREDCRHHFKLRRVPIRRPRVPSNRDGRPYVAKHAAGSVGSTSIGVVRHNGFGR